MVIFRIININYIIYIQNKYFQSFRMKNVHGKYTYYVVFPCRLKTDLFPTDTNQIRKYHYYLIYFHFKLIYSFWFKYANVGAVHHQYIILKLFLLDESILKVLL